MFVVYRVPIQPALPVVDLYFRPGNLYTSLFFSRGYGDTADKSDI